MNEFAGEKDQTTNTDVLRELSSGIRELNLALKKGLPERRKIPASLTVLALAIGIGSLFIGLWSSVNLRSAAATLDSMDTTLESVIARLESVTTTLDSVTAKLQRLDASVNLNSDWSDDYIAGAQTSAQDADPPYLEPKVPEGSVLIAEGRKLLDGKLMREVRDIITADPEIPVNSAIIKLKVPSLYYKAQAKGVPLDVMIGVVAAYIDETKAELM